MTPFTILAAIVLVGVLITVHEFGHFIVAKMCGVKVEVFSIGFGRPIVEIKRGETQYRIAWIPFGGYVRMLGQDPGDEVEPEDVGRSLPEQSAFARILIYAAGPAMNLLLPFLIVLPMIGFSSQYDELHSSRVGATDHSMPGYLAGLRKGDRITEVNGQPVHAFWQVVEQINAYGPDDEPLQVVVERDGGSKTLSVRPKAVHYTDPFLGYTRTTYVIGYQPDQLNPLVAVTDPNSDLARSGLKTFDRVVSIDGVEIKRFADVESRLGAIQTGQEAVVVVERTGRAILPSFDFLRALDRVTLTYRRESGSGIEGLRHAGTCVTSVNPAGAAGSLLKSGDCLIAVDGFTQNLGAFLHRRLNTHPEKPKTIEWIRDGRKMSGVLQRQEIIHTDPMAGDITLWSLGFAHPRYEMVPNEKVENQSRLAYAWYEAKTRFTRQTEQILRAIGGMFTGAVSPTQLSGPLTIFQLAGRAAREGWDVYLNLMVLLSLSIGFFNLLPIPLLDGGHILVAFFELIARRPTPPGFLDMFQRVGVLFILGLFIFAMVNDSVRTWRSVQPDEDPSIDRLNATMAAAYRHDLPGHLRQLTPETRADIAAALGLAADSQIHELAERLTVRLGWGYEHRAPGPPRLVEGAQDPARRVVQATIGARDSLVTLRRIDGQWRTDLRSVRFVSPSTPQDTLK